MNIDSLLSQISEETIDRQIRRKSLKAFTCHTFDGDYQVNEHHERMFEKIDQWVEGKIDRLMIFTPPRHGKSEIVSRRLPAYLLGKYPDDHVIATSYASGLARRMSRDVQRIIDSRAYREIFPHVILPRGHTGAKSTGYVRTSDTFELVGYKGGYISAGAGGAITGMGGKWVIIDDPVKNWLEANSETIRERIWEWYGSTLYTRLEKDARILVTMTRWHPDDLAGRLIEAQDKDPEADRWEILNMPALNEKGEALWPEKKDAKALKRIKASIPGKIWGALYQQNPVPEEGDIWKADYIQTMPLSEIMELNLKRVGYDWDLAYTEKESNSASAYVKSGIWDGKMIIFDIGWKWLEFPELIEWMKGKEGVHYIEAKASGKSAKQSLSRQGVTAIEVDVEGDKIARTNMITPYGSAGKIIVADHLRDRLLYDSKQGILSLSKANSDIDLNDALVQAAVRLLKDGSMDWNTLFDDEDLMREGVDL